MGHLRHSEQGPRLHPAALPRAFRIALSAALLAAAVACHTSSPRVTAPGRAPPPPSAQAPADASYDWRGLLIAPFGSVLKDIPAALHEVLLFRDEAQHGGASADNASAADAECYATDAPAPRFVGRVPDEYLLCFRQDRLSRIQASVRLTAAEASEVFAAACTDWLKNAAPKTAAPNNAVPNNAVPNNVAPAASGIETPGVAVRSDAAPIGAACEGRDGAIRFRGRVEEDPGQAEMPHTEAVLSIILDSAPNP
jgi:hypothetical protein